jgi:4-hydroxythreonine-4-phosphate dehydrogenase
MTMGDAGGIGPEVLVKSLAMRAVRKACRPLVIGDMVLLRKCRAFAKGKVRFVPARDASDLPMGDPAVPVIDPCRRIRNHRWGVIRKAYGEAAMGCVRYAVEAALLGKIDGIVTAPICKEAIHRAGYRYQGHTDYLARLTGTARHAMMLAGRGLRVVLVTIHIPIAEVRRRLRRDAILDAIRLAHGACVRLGIRRPRVGVCGLNPHAGEGGAFGRAEIEQISPAIRAAVREGIRARGPFPADTIFVESNRRQFDVIVAMYHDQGLIPLKMIAFDVGVNVTLGLPIVRTSPDHGTAFDIAGKGVADAGSMVEAIMLAARLCRRKP